MTTITLQKKSEIFAEGKRTRGNCKPVFCIDTGKVYASVSDAAEDANVTNGTMSRAITKNRGNITCKGKRYCFISEVVNYLDEISKSINERESKVEAYDKIIAEEEAIRKAEEERQKAIEEHHIAVAKASERLARCKETCAKLEEKLQAARQKALEAEDEFIRLKKEEVMFDE